MRKKGENAHLTYKKRVIGEGMEEVEAEIQSGFLIIVVSL